MFRSIITLAAMTLILGFGFEPLAAQVEPIPDEMRVRQLPRQQLSGPRFGFTTFTGQTADDRRTHLEKGPIMSQFGWQFETQIVSTTTGNQALMEWVALVGGAEQNDLTFSLAWLAGYRMPNGLELGVGPNVSYNDTTETTTTSMVLAAGATLPFGEIYVPLNMAVAFAEGGPRITTLIGWIIG